MKNLVYRIVAFLSVFVAAFASAVDYPTVFFNATQVATPVSSTINLTTFRSGDYEFSYSVDGYWAPVAGGQPTGRFFTVVWPNGIQAQSITAGPLLGKGANITIKRIDGKKFDLKSFTGKILLNTAGAGAAFEIMPKLNGEDAFNDPLQYDCTGYGGQSFSYVPNLLSYDSYQVHMWGDFALTALTLSSTTPPAPPANYTISASASPAAAGTVSGTGTFASGTSCTLTATANAGWRFDKWTEGAATASTSASYTFTVSANRTLVAVFVALPPPIAAGGTFYQLSGQPLTINIADLMAFDMANDGGPVSFVSAAATTSNGRALAVDTNTMQITIPANTAADHFTYTIADGAGATATGTANIAIIAQVTGASVGVDPASSPGTMSVNFTGVPWYTYTVQRCTSLSFTGPSLQTWTVQAWADGTISVFDDFSDLGAQPGQAYYRMVIP